MILKNLKLKNSLVLCSVLLGNIFKIVCGLIKNVLESERERQRDRERKRERDREREREGDDGSVSLSSLSP